MYFKKNSFYRKHQNCAQTIDLLNLTSFTYSPKNSQELKPNLTFPNLSQPNPLPKVTSGNLTYTLN